MKKELPYILIVDDNLINLKVTTEFLRYEGYRIGLAQNGPIALEQVNVQKPDLILLDIMMPEMDGLEVCRILKKDANLADIPIIFLTAKIATEDLVEAFNAGGVDYITKPFQKDELLARVKTHIDLFKARKQIEDMNKSRDKLYSIIAHDIKTPFSNIMLLIEALKLGSLSPDSSDFREILERLSESSNSTFALLINLLTWTRFQGNLAELKIEENNLSTLLYENILLMQEVAKNKEIDIITDLPEQCLAFFDETTISAVFRNLISNALKFTKRGGQIRIYSVCNEHYQKVIVKDSGTGMASDFVNSILTDSLTPSSPGTENEPGTGLGLIMVKDFVSSNNGLVSINSELNIGTEVNISLPLNKTK